jgi:glycosyltransferase involved in cell wall biosynthesis
MKVLIIGGYSPSLVNFRGHLLHSMIRAGHEVHAAAPELLVDERTSGVLREMGVEPHDMPIRRTGLNPVADLHAAVKMMRLMRRLRPDAVLAYTAKPVIWSLLTAAWAGVPRRFALITGLGYAFAEQPTGKRAVVGRVVRVLYRLALSRASKVFFQNTDDAQLFAQLGLLQPGTPRAVVSGSGVDLDKFSIQPLPDGALTFLLIARLLGDKGIREYIAAAADVSSRYPDVRFELVGPRDESPDGITARELNALLASGKVRWHGETEDVRPFIARCHVFVLPSYREGTPRTVLEAMALGRPIITTDAPGCRETVEDGTNGFLVEPRSPAAVAAAMLRFIETPAILSGMGRESRRMVEARYDVRVVSREMLREMSLA